MPSVAQVLAPPSGAAVPAFDEVYAAHIGFVWRVLRTLGVPDTQIEDAVQDVFVVVHRRLAEWQGRAAITTWLFAIARRVAAAHRRRAMRDAARSVEPLSDELPDDRPGVGDPFAEISRAQDNPANAGFVRPGANLAVVILADEDDCSVLDPALFAPEPTVLGPLDSFRCFAQGVICDRDDPGVVGDKHGCRPRDRR